MNAHDEDPLVEAVEDVEEEMYECSSCQMHFTSVMEHVRRFHNGQNVVIEMDDEAGGETTTKKEAPEEEAEVEVEQLDEEESTQQEEAEAADPDPPSVYLIEYLSGNTPAKETKIKSSKTVVQQKPAKSRMTLKTRVVKTPKFWQTPPDSRKLPTCDNPDPIANEDVSEGIEVLHKCNECSTVFPNNKSLRLHMKMHKPIHQRTIEEAMQSDLRGVREADANEEKATFYCSTCKKEYDETFMEVHMRMHSQEPSFHCGICNKKFDNEESFTMHSNAHQERTTYVKEIRKKDTPRPYACQYCQKTFIRPHEKVKHERIHTGEKPHACEVCGKTFRVAYCLTLHMRTHTMVRPYVCSICGRRFKAQAVYNHHLKTHSDERNYKCPFCPKTFKTAVQLSGHKNSHTKPFSCTECNRPFASLYAVRTHMEMHRRPCNGLRYKCDICGATYARNSSVKDHIKEAHNMDPLVDEGELFTEIDRSTGEQVEQEEEEPKATRTRNVAKTSKDEVQLHEETITMDDDEVLVAEAEWIN
ncbi:zinc finger protein 391-like [Lutzomyia longipalpis]|uniref:zinc finger protein 391-like n=1 Tax=Lutzomyia longipalpis TaxID=7200 RepID=UPI0024844339|nr:zinc finger protein 391-like [Lutzomyia longipalpis]